jgi:Ca-activated chloride channel homolog
MTHPVPRLSLRPDHGALPSRGGRVEALVILAVDLPDPGSERDPVALSLVIDHSGSMSGPPLEHAILAARQAVRALAPGDHIAVVVFDNNVNVVVPSSAVGQDRRTIEAAVGAITAGGTTALHAGWVEGYTQALQQLVDKGLNRVVLLSDGLANVGLTDPAAIAMDVRDAATAGVSTSTIGLGRSFDEHLLRHLADAGGGSYTFVESPAGLADLFETELAGLAALRGRNLRISLRGPGASFVAVRAGAQLHEGALLLPELVAGLPLRLLATLEIAPGDTAPALELAWDDTLLGSRQTIDVPLTLERVDAAELAARPVDPEVEAQRRRDEADRRMAEVEDEVRRGRFGDASLMMDRLSAYVSRWAPGQERDERLAHFDGLRRDVLARDADLAAKKAHMMRVEHERGYSRHQRNAMMKQTRERRGPLEDDDRAAVGAARSGAAGASGERSEGTLARYALARADGSRVSVDVVLGDLTEQRVEAIVNPTNRGLFGTSGVDGAIHTKAGPELTDACRAIRGIDYGEAVHTPGFRLPARYVIHTVARPWRDDRAGETKSLYAAYRASLDVARGLRASSIALPAMGTGSHGYPPEIAAQVAVDAVLSGLRQPSPLTSVRFVVRGPALAAHYQRLLGRALEILPD